MRKGHKCRVCGQKLRQRTHEGHHLEYSPVDHGLCVGCWIGWIDMEKFLIRATGGTYWSLQVEDAMKLFIEMVRSHSVPV